MSSDLNHEFEETGDRDRDERPADISEPVAEQAPFVAVETPVVAQAAGLATPSRLHPLSIFFDVSAHIRSLIIPAIIAVFSAASGSIEGIILAAVFFLITLTQSVIRYFSLRYLIRDRELIVTEGIFFRRKSNGYRSSGFKTST